MSTDNFSAKEAGLNLKFAECMQKTCDNLNPWLYINRSYLLNCDLYWQLLHIHKLYIYIYIYIYIVIL